MTYGQMTLHLIEGLRRGIFVAARHETGLLQFATPAHTSVQFREHQVPTSEAVAELKLKSVAPWYRPN